MRKFAPTFALLMTLLLVLSACGTPATQTNPSESEATAAPTAVATSTPFSPTQVPTITPRPMEGEIERPAAGATAILIDPTDKPTRPPIEFGTMNEFTSQSLAVSFKIPASWTVSAETPNALVFTEPMDHAQMGFPASVTLTVASFPNNQIKKDATTQLDSILNELRTEYPQLEVSSKADNSMLGEMGQYVTYWINMTVGENQTLRTRGRCLVVPKGKKLYQLRYLCPADYNSDYEKIFVEIRKSLKEL